MHVTTRENDKEKENNKTNLHSAVTISVETVIFFIMILQNGTANKCIFQFQVTNVMHIIGATDFPLFCSNCAGKCLILPAECSPPKSLILLGILPAEFIQAYL